MSILTATTFDDNQPKQLIRILQEWKIDSCKERSIQDPSDGRTIQYTGSLSQSAFIVTMRNVFSPELGNLKYVVYAHEKVKLFSVPLMEYILAFSAESSINEIEILKKISDHIKSVGQQQKQQLTLHPPSNVLDEDKKKTLKNLYESGMEEEAISD